MERSDDQNTPFTIRVRLFGAVRAVGVALAVLRQRNQAPLGGLPPKLPWKKVSLEFLGARSRSGVMPCGLSSVSFEFHVEMEQKMRARIIWSICLRRRQQTE